MDAYFGQTNGPSKPSLTRAVKRRLLFWQTIGELDNALTSAGNREAGLQHALASSEARAAALMQALASSQAHANDETNRANDETNRANEYLKIIGELEARLASTDARATDETNRANGYLQVIRDVEAQAARAENALAAMTPGGPPNFPLLEPQPDDLRGVLGKYLEAIPSRVELALHIYRARAGEAAKHPAVIAALAYLHYIVGDLIGVRRQFEKLDLAELANVIPSPHRTVHAFLWLLCNYGNRDAAATLLDGVARQGDKEFDALQLPGHTAARQADARRRGVPAILFNTTPKSGTVFLQSSLAQVLDAPIFRISLAGFIDERVIPEMARRFAQGGAVGFHHIPPTPQNLDILRRAGLTRIVIHLRDPRQCVVSLLMNTQHWNVKAKEPGKVNDSGIWGLDLIEISPPNGYQEMSAAQLQEWLVQTYAPIYCDWIDGWVQAAQSESFQIKLVTYEDFLRDKQAYYGEIAEFFRLDAGRIVPELLKIEPEQGQMHFRSGRVDEWREVLTRAEQDLCWSLMKPAVRERFNWPQ